MKLIKSKKGISFLLVIAIAAISAVGAFAYWTTSGSGTGSADDGHQLGRHRSPSIGSGLDLVPGGPAQDVSTSTSTTRASFNQYVGTRRGCRSTDVTGPNI